MGLSQSRADHRVSSSALENDRRHKTIVCPTPPPARILLPLRHLVGQAILPAAGFRAGLPDTDRNPDLTPIANRRQVTNLHYK
jgi:hypothetical protein